MRNKNQAFIINTKAKKKILNELLIYNQTSLQEQKYCLLLFEWSLQEHRLCRLKSP